MDIKCTQSIFKSTNGSTNVSYYIFMPQGVEIRGIVQISHGMCEYMSRYTAFSKYLCGLGFIVCGNDHIGHGSSVQNQALLGFFAQKDGWRCLVEDMYLLTNIMKNKHPDLPYFLFGHSMGSLITRLYIAKYGNEVSGAIICGTIGPSPIARTGISLADSMVHSKGTTYRSSRLHQLAFQSYNRRIKNSKSEFSWLSRDTVTVELFENDEKCNFNFTASGYRDLFTLVQQANHNRCYRATPKALPLLLISGDCDPAGAYGEGVRRVARMYQIVGVKDLDVIFYKDARHEILNEINRLDVFADISRWLERQFPLENQEDNPDSSVETENTACEQDV